MMSNTAQDLISKLKNACIAALEFIDQTPTDSIDYRDADEVIAQLSAAIEAANKAQNVP